MSSMMSFQLHQLRNGLKLDVPSMKRQITEEIFKRYRFKLTGEWWNECKCLVLLREVCLKLGIQLKAREYNFEKVNVIANENGKHKKTNGANGHKVDDTTFYPEDILNVVPIVKDTPLRVCRLKTNLISRVPLLKKLSKPEKQPFSKDRKTSV
jgi:hypothetical protein